MMATGQQGHEMKRSGAGWPSGVTQVELVLRLDDLRDFQLAEGMQTGPSSHVAQMATALQVLILDGLLVYTGWSSSSS